MPSDHEGEVPRGDLNEPEQTPGSPFAGVDALPPRRRLLGVPTAGEDRDAARDTGARVRWFDVDAPYVVEPSPAVA